MNHDNSDGQRPKLSGEEIAKRNKKDDLVIIIQGRAYDLTEFAPEHPGGSAILYKYGGRDATEAYEPMVSPSKFVSGNMITDFW